MIDKISSLMIQIDSQQITVEEAIGKASFIIEEHDREISKGIAEITESLNKLVDKL